MPIARRRVRRPIRPAFTAGVVVGASIANSNQTPQYKYPQGSTVVKFANGVDGYYFNGAYYTLDGRLVSFEK